MISNRLKQRLVGILVLAALALIFFPALFNLHPPKPVDESTQIPPAPDIAPVVVEEPVQPLVVDDVPASEELFILEEEAQAPPAASVPAAHSDPEAMELQDVAPVEVAPVNVLPAKPKPEAAAPPAKAPPAVAPKLAPGGLPEAWIIQAASYREEATAKNLAARLQAAGFKAFVRTAKSGGVAVFRVYVGPHLLRKNADDEKGRIDASLGVNALVLPFEP